jgi:hypothetical protein
MPPHFSAYYDILRFAHNKIIFTHPLESFITGRHLNFTSKTRHFHSAIDGSTGNLRRYFYFICSVNIHSEISRFLRGTLCYLLVPGSVLLNSFPSTTRQEFASEKKIKRLRRLFVKCRPIHPSSF